MILLRFGIMKFRFAYGRDQNSAFLWFWDFWTRHRALKPIIFILGNTRTPKTNQEKSPNIVNTMIVVNLGFFRNSNSLTFFEKTGSAKWWRPVCFLSNLEYGTKIFLKTWNVFLRISNTNNIKSDDSLNIFH